MGRLVNKMQFSWIVFSDIILQFVFQVTLFIENSTANEIKQWESMLHRFKSPSTQNYESERTVNSVLTYAMLFYVVIERVKHISWTKYIYLIPWEIIPFWIQVYTTF